METKEVLEKVENIEQRVKRIEHLHNLSSKKKVYISGKITGTDDFSERFENAENKLECNSLHILNPVKFCNNLSKKSTWEDYMRCCIHYLSTADAIYMMSGWEDSKGANEELRLAKLLGIEVIYE